MIKKGDCDFAKVEEYLKETSEFEVAKLKAQLKREWEKNPNYPILREQLTSREAIFKHDLKTYFFLKENLENWLEKKGTEKE